jgi:hypothetical protein
MQLGLFASDSSDAVACLNKANATTQVKSIDTMIGNLSAGWKPTGYYTPADIQMVHDLLASEAEAAGVALANAPRSTRDAETMISIAFEDLLSKFKDPARHMQQAVLEARRTGAQIIDAPNLKRWVISSMRAISDAYVTATVMHCRQSWIVTLLDKGYRAIASIGGVVWKVSGVAAEIVVAAGEAVVKVAGGAADALRIAGSIAKWTLRIAPFALAGLGGFYAYKKLKKQPALQGKQSELDRLYAERLALRREHASASTDKEIRAINARLNRLTEKIVAERRRSGAY